ncbi:MAG: ADP-ribosylglycohydrolase family protein [Actinomycetota bacterium]
MVNDDTTARIRNAWLGRISGCMLGKPVEMTSMMSGRDALTDYLNAADALPLRDYVPAVPDTVIGSMFPQICRGNIDRAVPDDDINYTVIALMLVEKHGVDFTTADVARAWMNLLPGGMTFTAERAAYAILLDKAGTGFTFGAPPEFDLAECSDNEFNDWIGAQIRADLYGWIAPGDPAAAADMARRDAALSHRGAGIHGAQAVAALGAAIPSAPTLLEAVGQAAAQIPADSECAEAIELGIRCAADGSGPAAIHDRYDGMSPVHTVNNLALVVWGLLHGEDDFGTAIGDTVAAGWDTDCNGATVGALWGLTGRPIPAAWTAPWSGRVETTLAGVGELAVDDLIDRTLALLD